MTLDPKVNVIYTLSLCELHFRFLTGSHLSTPHRHPMCQRRIVTWFLFGYTNTLYGYSDRDFSRYEHAATDGRGGSQFISRRL